MVVKVAEENRIWGYDRMVGATKNLGHRLSRQTVATILKRNGLKPAPERGRRTTWKDFIRSHLSVLAATDFFTAEVWTSRGLITYHVLFVMRMEVCCRADEPLGVGIDRHEGDRCRAGGSRAFVAPGMGGVGSHGGDGGGLRRV